jgi:hypothetical protein
MSSSSRITGLSGVLFILVLVFLTGCDETPYERAAKGAVDLQRSPFCVYPAKEHELVGYALRLQDEAQKAERPMPYTLGSDEDGNMCIKNSLVKNGDVFAPRDISMWMVDADEGSYEDLPSLNP